MGEVKHVYRLNWPGFSVTGSAVDLTNESGISGSAMTPASVINPERLKCMAAEYLRGIDLSPIDEAWEMAAVVHKDTAHFSGEPYLLHALEVASTLASMRLDLDTIVSGLLHGVLKRGMEPAELRQKFGDDVAYIVGGMTRITTVKFNNRQTSQAEYVRRMLMAMAKDIRVLLVRLVDRFQDMLVLSLVSREQQREVARETMDLYAPLAGRLGIDWLKRGFEDRAFKFLHPQDYEDISTRLQATLTERQAYVDRVVAVLTNKLTEGGVTPKLVFGRPKHLFSIYKKLIAQNITIDQVYDRVAFRIIVGSVNQCYEALGLIHADWVPVPGRIKDFISVPKPNNYQSLHTTVNGPENQFMEIQIRTEEMDRVAQEGVAAHWAYKEGQPIEDRDAKLFRGLKGIVNSLREVEDPREFLEGLRGELHDPEVYALTPNGEVKELPAGSCPLDFAYAIHTEVGDHCKGAKVNGRMVPLKYQLQNGDIVEIITAPDQRPRRGWLDFVKTNRARTRIRAWLRREERDRALALGKEISERELRRHDLSIKKLVKSGHIKVLFKELRCNSLDDMLVKIGSGDITVQMLLKALDPPEMRQEHELAGAPSSPEELAAAMVSRQHDRSKAGTTALTIDGIDDMLVKISQCCRPVPGDPIIGFITSGRGVSVHKSDCRNLLSADPRRWIEVDWHREEGRNYRADLFIVTENRRTIHTEISAVISTDVAQITSIAAHTTATDTVEFTIGVQVNDVDHLAQVMRNLRHLEPVISVRRI
jgi:guanosine-3',5'-bis(diphosphate) 3'-pyrophosphohydrolase